MKLRAIILSSLIVLPSFAKETPAPPPVNEWPMKIEGARSPIIMYQPQPESLEGNKLTGRAAVSIQPEGSDPVFGAIWMEAKISTDRDARIVTVKDIEIPRVRFPGATPEQESVFGKMLAEALTQKNFLISLDRLLVSLENAKKEASSTDGLKTDPPKIYFEKTDAMLVLLDGEPQLRPIKDSPDQRVVNTPLELTFTKEKKWRLKLTDRWITATDLNGPWTDDASASTPAPKIIISKEPAELIVSKGEPKYTALPGKDLSYMSTTDSNVFLEKKTKSLFVLLSGRWYTAADLNGPWTFVRSDQLPKAFSKIPVDSPKASVRVSVAGTDEAKEALMDAQMPQTAAVSRKEKDGKLQVTWDGDPKFKDLENLTVSYSVNASIPVFRVGKSGYWACTEGVWYMSEKPTGPWLVATAVPKDIYQIPPSCPYYNCRYVHIYDTTPEVVYVGYYPGYVGSYPYYGTVVYGTGYYYGGYYGVSYYYPSSMITFGIGFSYYPYYGWGGGYYPVYPIHPGHGWWGPGGYPGGRWRGDHVEHHGSGDRGQNIYNRASERGPHASTQPSTGARGDRGPHASTQPSTRDRGNNVYADRDGNISRQDKDGKWQDRSDKGGWKDSSGPKQDIAHDSQARDRGAQRTSQYQTSRPSYSGGGMRGGGGGMRGGGRR